MPPAQWKLRATAVPAEIAKARRARPVTVFFTCDSPFQGRRRLRARPTHTRHTAKPVPVETGGGRRPVSLPPHARTRDLTAVGFFGCQARSGDKTLSRPDWPEARGPRHAGVVAPA